MLRVVILGEYFIDVTGYVDLPGASRTAVSVFAPDRITTPVAVLFCFPGGGYSRGYYDIHRPELSGPSQAEYHVARGRVVVTCDHLGVGGSSQPDPASITFEHLAAANHGTVAGVLAGLADGTLSNDLPAISPETVVGIGQSMGGCIGIIQQAKYRSFDALAVLGYSGTRMRMPEPSDGGDPLRHAFHWDEEPRSLIDADLGGFPQPWRSRTMPSCVATMAQSGLIVQEAGEVEVPLFLAAGERDVIEDLYTEPSAFRRCRDITLFLLIRAAHMHNFAPTRMELWQRLDDWIQSLLKP
jgi:pimeloyl-ACP methyl ester carboxylesterase